MTRVPLPPLAPLPGTPALCPLDGAARLADLEYYDGPLCCVFRDAEGLLLVAWADQDDEAHRWLIARVPRAVLDAMGDGAVTFRGAFLHPDVTAWWLSDRDGERVIRCARVERGHVTDAALDVLPGDVVFPRDHWHETPDLTGASRAPE